MAPAPEPAAAAVGRKRSKPHGPPKALAEKRTDGKSASAKEEKHKHKEKKPRPAGPHARRPADPDHTAAAGGGDGSAGGGVLLSAAMPPARQLEFLLRSFERAAKMRLSPLELDSYSDGCMVQLAEGASQDVESFGDHVKGVFGASWKEELCEGEVVEGQIGVGSPALLVISSAALRSLELLRGLKMFTKECRPVKLFAKHLKVEEQVTMLNARVNIACGNTEFGGNEIMLRLSMGLGEQICKLELRRHILKTNHLILHCRTNVEAVDANVFGELMAPVLSQCTVVEEGRATPKNAYNHRSQVTSAVTEAKSLEL
ncbi:hypothetical protein U9M48_031947 [Paspalum notatum var. saurae]|uniref:Uncharacterized protein n=1 Tax=Paspalum notatum var. saurae TaxID=547442 RepID=A0AAQ3U6U4_PASNO